MPELPEVEIVRRELERWLVGATILRARCADRRIAKRSLDGLVGKTVRSVGRRGKWLRVELDEGLVFSHLGMTGDWAFRADDEDGLRFERARLDAVHDGKKISARYVDMRRWGKLIASKDDIAQWTELGPDPLHEGIDPNILRTRIAKRRGSIKVALMDQTVLAGVGNILAIEALWKAKVDPRTRARRMKPAQILTLVRALRAVIRRTLAYDERMISDENARSPFRIYGKERCARCKGKLRRIVLGGRSTTFCPTCQKR